VFRTNKQAAQAKQLWGKGVGLGVCRFLLKPTKNIKNKEKMDQQGLPNSLWILLGMVS